MEAGSPVAAFGSRSPRMAATPAQEAAVSATGPVPADVLLFRKGKLRPDTIHRFPAIPVCPYVNCITIIVKSLKRHWCKVVKSAMFTKVIIQFTSRVPFPLIKRPDPFAENKENAKK